MFHDLNPDPDSFFKDQFRIWIQIPIKIKQTLSTDFKDVLSIYVIWRSMYVQVYLARSNSDNEWYRVLVVARYKNMQGKL